mgnify:CR=1 FL=1|jgi:uncharacterized protein
MATELDPAAIAATLIVLSTLAGSTALWVRKLRSPRSSIIPNIGIGTWPIGWVNFVIFICAAITSIAASQFLGSAILNVIGVQANQLTPWLAVAAVLLLQIPLLAVFYITRRFFPAQYASQLNSHAVSIGLALKQAAPYFLRFLPIIWIVSFLWTKILSDLQEFGLIGEFPPQQLVQLFQSGGDPLAICLLVIFAVLLAPIVEELIFRGCIYRFLKSQTSLLLAQLISGVIFALIHANLLSFVPLVLVGILLARSYEKSGNILVPICFHALFNGFSLLMLLIYNQSQVLQP